MLLWKTYYQYSENDLVCMYESLKVGIVMEGESVL